MISKIKQFFTKNPFVTILVVSMVIITIISLTITLIVRPHNKVSLTAEESKLQSAIQDKTGQTDLFLSKVIINDNNWTLSEVNIDNNMDNIAFTIMDGDNVVIGPGTGFSIESLVDAKIPDKIVDYFYPEKPQWVYFTDDFNSYFPYSQGQVKFIITAFAQQNNIDLNRVVMKNYGKVTQRVDNPYDDNRTETREFKFTINNDPAEYTFRDFYQNTNSTNTYSILDANSDTLYSQVVSLY